MKYRTLKVRKGCPDYNLKSTFDTKYTPMGELHYPGALLCYASLNSIL
jgi:hypothetical protein